jgi:hypothetical protein
MLPPAPTLLLGIAFFLRRHGLAARIDAEALADALAQAADLAAGNEGDEPAALFFACVQRAQAFFPTASKVVPHLARSHASAVGLELHAADVALDIHYARILRREMSFDELRAWFAARLAPKGPPLP